MPSVTRYAGAAASDATYGDISWNNPSSATGAPDTATSDVSLNNEVSEYLVLTDFNFAAVIPSGSTILGVSFTVWWAQQSGFNKLAIDNRVVLALPGGLFGSDDHATGALIPAILATTTPYGGPADLWDGVDYADVTDADFGLALAVEQPPHFGNDVYFDAVACTVEYSPPWSADQLDYTEYPAEQPVPKRPRFCLST